MFARAWRWYVAVGILATAAYFTLDGGLAQGLLYEVIGLSGAAAIVVGVRRWRPARPGLWYLIAIGQVMFVAGDFSWLYMEQWGDGVPYPSFADLFYLAGYPFIGAGLVLLIRGRSPRGDRAGLIDATIVATGLGVISWIYFMDPYAGDASSSILVRVVSVAYPLMDVLLLGLLARLLLVKGVRNPSFHLLGGCLVLLLAADVWYTQLTLVGAYFTGHPSDAGWLLSYVLVGAAGLHASMRSLSEPLPEREVRFTRPRLVLLAAASLMAPAVLAWRAIRGEPVSLLVVAGGAATLFLLVVVRMAGLVREVASKANQLRAQGETLEDTVRELRTVEAERSRLLDRVLRTAEDERMGLAFELHDGPIQRLTALGYDLERANRRIGRQDVRTGTALLERVQGALTEQITGLRDLMSGLRPAALDQQGLEAALRDHVAAFERKSGVRCSTSIELRERLASELETVLYRVAQEGLANVGKHARAERASVALCDDGGAVVLEIRDDGVGFDPATVREKVELGHFGLLAMRERVQMAKGTWELSTRPGAGTAIRVSFVRQEPA